MTDTKTKLVDGQRKELTDEEIKQIESRKPELSEVQTQCIQEIKNRAYEVLSETDWYITRKQETGEAIPQDVLDHRSQVRSDSDAFEQDVNNLETVEGVLNYEYSFPEPSEV